MPTYTYRCANSHEWDELRTVEGSEASEAPCATCGQAGTKTVSNSPPAAHFKGRGWTPTFHQNRKGK